MSSDESIHARIARGIDAVRRLRAALAAGEITQESEHTRIRELEQQLDRLWDLLRLRRAERDAGQDPARAHERSVEQVEGYLE